MGSPVELLVMTVHRSGGRANLSDLLEVASRHHIRAAVASDRLVRVRHGVYALPVLPDERMAAARARGVLCRESAAVGWQLALLVPPRAIHVAVGRRARPPVAPGVCYHWRSAVSGAITDVLTTVLDCATALPFAEALTIADSALRDGHFTLGMLIHAARTSQGPGRARRLRVACAASSGAANPFESALRAVLIDGGITGLVTQFVVRGGDFTAQVDLADPGRRIAIEADSFTYHASSQRAFDRDVRRYDELVRHGWLVLRFTWSQVMTRPDWVVSVVSTVCTLRPPTRLSPEPAAGPPKASEAGVRAKVW